MRGFREFNARDAQCFKESDREALLGVIESGFGSFDSFNAIVRSIFASRLAPQYSRTTTFAATPAAGAAPRPLRGLALMSVIPGRTSDSRATSPNAARSAGRHGVRPSARARSALSPAERPHSAPLYQRVSSAARWASAA